MEVHHEVRNATHIQELCGELNFDRDLTLPMLRLLSSKAQRHKDV